MLTCKAALQSGSSTSQWSSINQSFVAEPGIVGLDFSQSVTSPSDHAQSTHQGILSCLLHRMTLQTRVSGFLACTKILSAFTWSQKIGIKASMTATGSSALLENIVSRSAGKAGGLSEIDIMRCRVSLSASDTTRHPFLPF